MKKRGSKKPVKIKGKFKKTEPLIETARDDSSLKEGREESQTLTDTERQELTGLEDTIRGSQKQFIAVGSALTAIHDKHLYKEVGGFDDYCDKKWGFSGTHARRLMDAYKVIKTLRSGASPIGEELLPRNEYQARTLHDSGHESSWVESWMKVLEAAKQDSTAITGTLVKETLTPDTGTTSNNKDSSKNVVVRVLKWIDEKREKLSSVEAAKELLTKIENELKKLKK